MTSLTTIPPTMAAGLRDAASLGGTALPSASGIVIAFAPRSERSPQLTVRDRLSVAEAETTVALLGYDRLVIHPRRPGDPAEFGDIVLVYRPADPWACLGFARQGEMILAWNCVTGVDIGRFCDMDEAFASVLGRPAGQMRSATVLPIRPGLPAGR